MDGNRQANIEVSDVFNTFTYLDNAVGGTQYEGWTMEAIVSDLESKVSSGGFSDDQKACIQYLRGAIDSNSDWGSAVLLDTSSTNNTASWKDDLIQGATFQMPNGDYFVAFRGTGDGRWTDNAKGMTLPSTEMQEAAAAYFDEVAERYNFAEEHANGAHIYDGGHSKGGNEAQYVVFGSEYGYLIDECYSMDGQGFSPEAIQKFKEKYGEEEYYRRLQDMYSICGENDPVHRLGIRIIPDENTYYVAVPSAGIVPWHDLKYMSGYEQGDEFIYDGLHWFRDENGNIINGEPGPGALLGEAISSELMKLPPDKRDGVGTTIMFIIDALSGTKLGNYNMDFQDWCQFWAYGWPVLEKNLFLTKEGHQAILGILEQVAKGNIEKHGYLKGSIITTLEVVATIVLAPIVLGLLDAFHIIGSLFDKAFDIIKNVIGAVKDIAKGIKEVVDSFVNAMAKFVDGVVGFFKSLDPDVRYANDNPHFIVDTAKLRGYGDSLSRINRTIASIDSRLDGLYSKVGLLDLWNLMQADILTSHNRHIERAANFCYDTANRFETAENNINKQW